MTNYTITSNFDITNLRLSDGAYRCYNLLLSLGFGNKTKVFPSQKYLACALGRSVRTIQRYIAELVGLNLIIKRRRGSISNLYILVQKKIQQGVDRLKNALKGKEQNTEGDVSKDTPKQDNKKFKTYPKYHKKKTTNFNDFSQRQYDFGKLEQALLGEGDYEFNEVLKE